VTAAGDVTIRVADGSDMSAYVARPRGIGTSAAIPAILIFQDALGVNGHLRRIADRYAALGFLAIAPELFHRVHPGFQAQTFDRDVIMPMINALTIDDMLADIVAAHAWAGSQPDVRADKIAAVGYCMGGRAVYLANSELPLGAAISYYGGGIAPGLLDRAPKLHGPHLFFWGGQDPTIPPERRRAVADAVRDTGKRFVDVEFSDANHGFFNELLAHHPRAAKESWALGRSFLEDTLEIELGQG
jgi:carboxymethylenebutenolidase